MNIRSSYLKALRNRIDLKRAPFSDRGSRLLISMTQDPTRLVVRLAERLTSIEPGLGVYLQRPPFIEDLSLVDGEGAPLDFEATTYPHALFFKTELGTFGLTFQDTQTILIGLPPHTRSGIRFVASPSMQHRYADGGDIRAVRDLCYVTNGHVLVNNMTSADGKHTVEIIVDSDIDASIALSIGPSPRIIRTVLPFPKALASAESRWHRWFDQTPGVPARFREQYWYAWWIMGNNLVSPQGYISHEAMMPSKSHYVGVWQWDAYFHALAYRHVDRLLAENQLRVMLACQREDGMIPDAIYDEGIVAEIDTPVHASVTKPPIAAWAALKLYRLNPDPAFLREIYPPLVRWNSWWFGMNDDDGDGIVQYNHPYSSGLDNSPLWDGEMPVESPELNTYLCLQQRALAEMAGILGKTAEAEAWHRRATALAQSIVEHFYDPEAGIFWAMHNHQPIRVLTPFNLYPLLTGFLDGAIAARLVKHLTDPATFWAEYPIPTVAISDPHYDPEVMWRGPTWININYLFIEGLLRAGYEKVADELRDRTLELVMSHNDIYEYYHSQTAEPPLTAAPGFGWSAALFIDLVIENSKKLRL